MNVIDLYSIESEEELSGSEDDASEYEPDHSVTLPNGTRESKRLKGIDANEKTWEERDANITSENPRAVCTRAERSEIRLLWACGYHAAQIAAEYSCSEVTIRAYMANKLSAPDNLESDDEHLGDEILLRLRREKRITIDVDLVRETVKGPGRQWSDVATTGEKRKRQDAEMPRRLACRAEECSQPIENSFRSSLNLPSGSARHDSVLQAGRNKWTTLSLPALGPVCAITSESDHRTQFIVSASPQVVDELQGGALVLYKAGKVKTIDRKADPPALPAIGNDGSTSNDALQQSCSSIVPAAPRFSMSICSGQDGDKGPLHAASTSNHPVTSFLSSLAIDMSKYLSTFVQLGINDGIAIAALRSCPRSSNEELLRQAKRFTAFEIHVILCGLHNDTLR